MPSPLPPALPVRVVGRRTLLGAAVGTGLAATGCSTTLDPTSDDPTFTPTDGPSVDGGTGSTGDGAVDDGAVDDGAVDDGALVADVLAAIALAHRTVRANARLHRGVARTLRPFEELHLTHARELGALPGAAGRVADASESGAQALARVDRREAQLQRSLVEAATSAGSGALAQSLASMAAAVAQLRTTL